jgi:hypothetical protein
MAASTSCKALTGVLLIAAGGGRRGHNSRSGLRQRRLPPSGSFTDRRGAPVSKAVAIAYGESSGRYWI